MDHPAPDPEAQAAADVERLLSGASGLHRIVEVARGVNGGGDPSVAPPEPDAPDRVRPTGRTTARTGPDPDRIASRTR